MSNLRDLVNSVVASPLGDVIASVGRGVAEAQHALDEASIATVLDIYAESNDEKLRLLQEIGYRPTFYALPETTGEVRVALRLGSGAAGAGQATGVKPIRPSVQATPARVGLRAILGPKLYAVPVDADYANHFGYSANVAAKLTFKIVPVPPPAGADELRLVPNVTGQLAMDALAALDRLELVATFQDADGAAVAAPAADTNVTAQIPEPNSIVRAGDSVLLTLSTS